MFLKHSPYSTNIGSPVDEEEIKIRMDDGVVRFFTRFGGILFLFVDLWKAQPCLWDPE